MPSLKERTKAIASCPTPTPEARAYADHIWMISKYEQQASRIRIITAFSIDEIRRKINKRGSKVGEWERKGFERWENESQEDVKACEKMAEELKDKLNGIAKAYRERRLEKGLLILQPEYVFEVNTNELRIEVGKKYYVARAAFVLSSTKEYFEKIIVPNKLTKDKVYIDYDTYFPKHLSQKAEEDEYLSKAADVFECPLPYNTFLPPDIAALAGVRRDGEPIDLQGPMRNPTGRQLTFRVISKAELVLADLASAKAKKKRESISHRRMSHKNTNVEGENAGVTTRDSDEESELSEIMSDYFEEDDFADVPYIQKILRKPKPKSEKMDLSYQPIPGYPDPYPVRYSPQLRADGGGLLLPQWRGKPPMTVDGSMLTEIKWSHAFNLADRRCYDSKFKKEIASGSLTRDDIRKHGFVREEAVRKLKKNKVLPDDYVDEPEDWDSDEDE